METTMKKCKVCGKVLPITEFAEHKRSRDGHRNTCKVCAGVHEKRGIKQITEVVKRSVEGGIAALKGISANDLIAELRFRGYRGKLTFSRDVVV